MFSAINCTLDSTNGAAIGAKSILRMLARRGVECLSLSASVYDRPVPGTDLDNLIGTGAKPVEEPGLPQSLWLGVDEGVHHYIVHTKGMTQRTLSREEEQTLFNRALAFLEQQRPDLLMIYGARQYERSLLKKARELGIGTVFYLVNPGYTKIEDFQHVDLIFTDSEATRQLYAERLGLDCHVIGTFVDPLPSASLVRREYVTFVNPSPEKGVTLFLRIAELAREIMPQARFLVIESRATLRDAEERTGINVSASGNIKRVGLQRDMGPIFAATRILLVPSLWHESAGRVMIEGFSHGVPVIASSRGGIPEVAGAAGIIIDPPAPLVANHWLIPPVTEAIPWVEAIRTLLSDDVVYEQYQQAAFAQWAYHGPEQRLPGLIADLEQLVAGKRG